MTAKKTSRRQRAKKRQPPRDGQAVAAESARQGVPEEQLQGPPARETTLMRGDRERAAEAHRQEYHNETSPRLTGGDPDADWERADHIGEEAVGGSVATPDQSVVDELGGALGVPRSPDEEVRTSGEILEGRDRHRWEQEIGGDA
jgi:Family of unknown function (DUF6335)